VVAILLLVFLANNARTEEKKAVASIGADGVQRVEVVGGSYFFNPNYIIVKVNVPVEMKIRKESGMVPHNFVLKAPEAGMDVTVELGKDPQTIRFTPTKVGEYPFYCDKKLLFFESHREKGMKGILKVEE
jgi:plastocyanin